MFNPQKPKAEFSDYLKKFLHDLEESRLKWSALQSEKLENRFSLIGTCNFPGCLRSEGHIGPHDCHGVCGGP